MMNETVSVPMVCSPLPILVRVAHAPPTGKSTATDYVYVMDFEGDKSPHDENMERRLGHEGTRWA